MPKGSYKRSQSARLPVRPQPRNWLRFAEPIPLDTSHFTLGTPPNWLRFARSAPPGRHDRPCARSIGGGCEARVGCVLRGAWAGAGPTSARGGLDDPPNATVGRNELRNPLTSRKLHRRGCIPAQSRRRRRLGCPGPARKSGHAPHVTLQTSHLPPSPIGFVSQGSPHVTLQTSYSPPSPIGFVSQKPSPPRQRAPDPAISCRELGDCLYDPGVSAVNSWCLSTHARSSRGVPGPEYCHSRCPRRTPLHNRRLWMPVCYTKTENESAILRIQPGQPRTTDRRFLPGNEQSPHSLTQAGPARSLPSADAQEVFRFGPAA
jgi:hypothetical protein